MTKSEVPKVFLDSNTSELFFEYEGKKQTLFFVSSTMPQIHTHYIKENARRVPEEYRKELIKELIDQLDVYYSDYTTKLRVKLLSEKSED